MTPLIVVPDIAVAGEVPPIEIGLMVVPEIVVSPFVVPLIVVPLITVPLKIVPLDKLWALALKGLLMILLGVIVTPLNVV